MALALPWAVIRGDISHAVLLDYLWHGPGADSEEPLWPGRLGPLHPKSSTTEFDPFDQAFKCISH